MHYVEGVKPLLRCIICLLCSLASLLKAHVMWGLQLCCLPGSNPLGLALLVS